MVRLRNIVIVHMPGHLIYVPVEESENVGKHEVTASSLLTRLTCRRVPPDHDPDAMHLTGNAELGAVLGAG